MDEEGLRGKSGEGREDRGKTGCCPVHQRSTVPAVNNVLNVRATSRPENLKGLARGIRSNE